MLQKLSGGNSLVQSSSLDEVKKNLGKSRIVILGKFEVFGMEDIINVRKYRTTTVECLSMEGVCHFITKENFIHCVNQYKFSQSVIEEQIVKHQRYMDRF